MRVLVVGTGSVGQRHIANLLQLGAQVDAFSYRGRRTADAFNGVTDFNDLRDALHAGPSAVVVANSTDLHMDVCLEAARLGCHLFVEKPLSNSLRGVSALVALATQHRLVVETGFMLRFHPNLQWMKAFLDTGNLGEIYAARAQFGQYLPEWRPGTDYRQCYSGRRGVGGVIFDLTHEIDLFLWLIGPVTETHAMTRYMPRLEIESEAMAQIGIRFASGALGQIHLDYLRPIYARTLEIMGSAGVLTWDYTAGTVHLATPGAEPRVVDRVPSGFQRNDMFRDHMQHFLARLVEPALPACASLSEGVAALRVALACHQSAVTGSVTAPLDVAEGFSVEERLPT